MARFDREAHEKQDAALIEDRLRLGDRPEIVREVDHAALFRRMSAARTAAADLERQGMRVDSMGRYWMRPMHVMV